MKLPGCQMVYDVVSPKVQAQEIRFQANVTFHVFCVRRQWCRRKGLVEDDDCFTPGAQLLSKTTPDKAIPARNDMACGHGLRTLEYADQSRADQRHPDNSKQRHILAEEDKTGEDDNDVAD
jgi:hypothetical protein